MSVERVVKSLLRFLLKPVSFLPAIAVMYMIYSFSAQDSTQSSQLSSGITHQIVQTIDQVFDMQLTSAQKKRVVNKAEHYVRKAAHFSEYCLLAITVALPLYVYGLRGFLLVLTVGFFCSGYACFDEFHQLFVSGRNGSKKDIIIDTCGAVLGIYITRIVCFVGRKTIFARLCK